VIIFTATENHLIVSFLLKHHLRHNTTWLPQQHNTFLINQIWRYSLISLHVC